MIAYLKGDFVRKTPSLVYIEVNGVGYEVQVTLNTYTRIQDLEKGLLHTILIIREDAHLLYGFFADTFYAFQRPDVGLHNRRRQLIGLHI